MKQFILKNRQASVAFAVCLLTGSIILMSFQDTPYVNQILNERPVQKDTVPIKSHSGSMRMKEFDKMVEDLEKNLFNVGDEMNQLDLELLQNQAFLSIQQLNIEKMLKEIEHSLKDVNVDKIMADVNASLKEINKAELDGEIEHALQEAKEGMVKAREELSNIDTEEIEKELKKASEEIKNINTSEIKKELERARLEMEINKDAFNKTGMNRIIAEAKESVEKAKLELQKVQAMFREMEHDGLINLKDGFSIEYKNKELYINGVKQEEPVTDKYRKYIQDDHFEITIEKE